MLCQWWTKTVVESSIICVLQTVDWLESIFTWIASVWMYTIASKLPQMSAYMSKLCLAGNEITENVTMSEEHEVLIFHLGLLVWQGTHDLMLLGSTDIFWQYMHWVGVDLCFSPRLTSESGFCSEKNYCCESTPLKWSCMLCDCSVSLVGQLLLCNENLLPVSHSVKTEMKRRQGNGMGKKKGFRVVWTHSYYK